MLYEKIYLYPGHHVEYYPGAEPIALKLIFSTKDEKILGAQAVGMEGVEKRIDVIAQAIQQNSTVFDLWFSNPQKHKTVHILIKSELTMILDKRLKKEVRMT